MKILLVALNAKYIHSNLAVYSLLAYAKKYSGNLDLLEMTINQSEDEILKEIFKRRADVVAFSCYIWNTGMVIRLLPELRKVHPEVRLWLGGPEVSYNAENFFKNNTAADGVTVGEGEQTFLELVKYYVEGKTELEGIKGLVYKDTARLYPKAAGMCPESADKGVSMTEEAIRTVEEIRMAEETIHVTEAREPILLDAIPFPYEDISNFQNRIIYYESSRGCPYSCSYCLSSIDRRVRFRSADMVKSELKLLLDHKVPQVKFIDRTFNCNRKHAMEIWKFIKENDNGITNFHFEISADLLEEDELEFLSALRPGQVQFEIGVQSTNPDTLAAIHRKMDFIKLSRNVRRLKEAKNLHVHLDLIAGLPFEGYSSFEKSFKEVYNLKPDQLQLGFLKVLKGSLMEAESKRYGIANRNNPPYEVLYTDCLTYEELLMLKDASEMVEIYYNSNQFTNTISWLEHYYDSPMKLYQDISEFYALKGIELMAHSRIKRYEILLDFYKEKVLKSRTEADGLNSDTRLNSDNRQNSDNKLNSDYGQSSDNKQSSKINQSLDIRHSSVNKAALYELFKELLTFDLYLREDMKSRPSFCPDGLDKKHLKMLYDKYRADRGSIHIEIFQYDVEACASSGLAIRKEAAILFDYGNRNPINHAARIEILGL